MQVEFSLRDLDFDIRYSGGEDCIKINDELLSKSEAVELAIKLQSASSEIFSHLERDIVKGVKWNILQEQNYLVVQF